MGRRSWSMAMVLIAAIAVFSVPGSAAQKGPKRDKNLITRAEIDSFDQNVDLYELIRRLRPNMLRGHTGTRSLTGGSNPVVVYVEGTQYEVAALRNLTTGNVEEVRYLDPIEAGNRYGLNHLGGAIVITRRRMGTQP